MSMNGRRLVGSVIVTVVSTVIFVIVRWLLRGYFDVASTLPYALGAAVVFYLGWPAFSSLNLPFGTLGRPGERDRDAGA